MAQIEVKYDPTLVLEPIVDIMYNTSTYDDPEGANHAIGEVEQTKVTGIAAPLIRVNDITINFTQVQEFELTCKDLLPTLRLAINDTLGLTKQLDQPKSDNIVRIEIIPPFDDAYQKVNLRFYITKFESEGEILYLTCKYNVKELYKNRLEAFGEISTYELADKIAKASQLGLASNISGIEDKRYMYCKNQSFVDLINNEIIRSGEERLIPQLWVDWHNYLNVVDMLERYNTKDQDLKVWTMQDWRTDTETGTDVKPEQVAAVISNSPGLQQSQLYTDTYEIVNNTSSNVSDGTDKIVEIYNYVTGESSSMLIQDGDVHDDTYIKTIYMGESFGSSNFQLQTMCREAVMQKIYGQCIKVSLRSPLLGLERGHKVELQWFDCNDITAQAKQENDIETTNPDPQDNDTNETMTINKQISGQYLILSTKLMYEGNGIKKMNWNYELLLCRPADEIKTYGDDNG